MTFFFLTFLENFFFVAPTVQFAATIAAVALPFF